MKSSNLKTKYHPEITVKIDTRTPSSPTSLFSKSDSNRKHKKGQKSNPNFINHTEISSFSPTELKSPSKYLRSEKSEEKFLTSRQNKLDQCRNTFSLLPRIIKNEHFNMKNTLDFFTNSRALLKEDANMSTPENQLIYKHDNMEYVINMMKIRQAHYERRTKRKVGQMYVSELWDQSHFKQIMVNSKLLRKAREIDSMKYQNPMTTYENFKGLFYKTRHEKSKVFESTDEFFPNMRGVLDEFYNWERGRNSLNTLSVSRDDKSSPRKEKDSTALKQHNLNLLSKCEEFLTDPESQILAKNIKKEMMFEADEELRQLKNAKLKEEEEIQNLNQYLKSRKAFEYKGRKK